MSANTKIEWADHTFNPWEGCQKVGPGCDHCYAETRNARFAGGQAINWGPGAPRRRTSAKNWQLPVKWNADAAAKGIRYRVFCASLADVFDNAVDPEWRADLFRLIEATPHLDWLLLTKRIGNAAEMMFLARGGHLPLLPNVWIGATIVNQEEADRDIPKLLAVPARVRFLSIEPMLGRIDLCEVFDIWWNQTTGSFQSGGRTFSRHGNSKEPDPRIHWIIVGGESGPGARPMHPDWARSLRDQCEGAGVPFLFKQWGEWGPRGPESLGYPVVDNVPRVRLTDRGENGQTLAAKGGNDCWMNRSGKKAAGRQLDGRTWDGVPTP